MPEPEQKGEDWGSYFTIYQKMKVLILQPFWRGGEKNTASASVVSQYCSLMGVTFVHFPSQSLEAVYLRLCLTQYVSCNRNLETIRCENAGSMKCTIKTNGP